MRRFAAFSLGTFLCLGLLDVAGQEDDVKALVKKAIKAHGGAANLAKQKSVHVKATGTLDFMNKLKFSTESFFQEPDKFKNVVELEINNMNIRVIQVFNGKKFWINAMDKTTELKDKKDIAELRENLYVEKLTNLVGLMDKGITLSPLGEVQINDKATIGVRASSKGHRDINLYFDKKSHMLVKSETRTVDFQTKQEVSQEKYYSDYQEMGGVQQPRKLIIHQDGKRHITLDITSVSVVERHEDSVFAEP
ncbi:MAG TPA: hypothetical protein VKE98_25030 [Gemmataceae bacterium]|nr:hypothetical protein [Gemmataceae bacterium]